jgi:DNA polymerase-3 subunit beta
MKFSIDKNILLKNLQKVIGPTNNKTQFPSLSCVLLETIGKKISFTTTDLDITIISNCFDFINIEDKNKALIPIKRFLSIIKELSSDQVELEKKNESLIIKSGKTKIKLRTNKVDDFPQIKKEQGNKFIKINSKILSEMLNFTSFCVGDDNSNYVLSGVLFNIEKNKISLVSTDGKRLSYIKRTIETNTEDEKFILPKKAVDELVKMIKEECEVLIFIKNNNILFETEETELIARTIDGEFPDYKQYIPKESEGKRLNINAKDLLSVLKRANVLSTSDYIAVKISLDEKNITISKATADIGEIEEKIEVYYKGDKLDIGFNPLYLIDILSRLDDEFVNIDFYGADKPAVLRKDDYEYLILPMKV